MTVVAVVTTGNFTPPTTYKLAGTVTVASSPIARLVVVLNRGTMSYISGTVSDASGNWEIAGLHASYSSMAMTVIAIDNAEDYNAVVADNVTPVT